MFSKGRSDVIKRLLRISILPILILGAILMVFEEVNLSNKLRQEMYGELRNNVASIEAYYESGAYVEYEMTTDGRVKRDKYTFVENFTLIDNMYENTGIYSSIYYGNKIVVSSMLDVNGNRVIGEKMNPDVEKVVLRKGNEYVTDSIEVGGQKYMGYFKPLVNQYGVVIGAYFTAKSGADVNRQLRANLHNMGMISTAVIIVMFALTLSIASGLIDSVYELVKGEETREELRLASNAKSEFLAHMSHEIRTPINAVLGMDEMILRECNDESIEQYALNIQNAGQTLLSIVNDILDFSKMESGKMELIIDRYPLYSLINDCYNLIYTRAEKKNLDVIIKSNPELPSEYNGDMSRLRQIVSNLLTNAVKYTKEGSVSLTIDYERVNDKVVNLIFTVSDTGIGIKQEDMDKLFESFERIDEKRNQNIEGTGLGLTIVRKLVRMMSGTVDVSSVYEEGTTFVVKIPQEVADIEPMGDFVATCLKKADDRVEKRDTFTAQDAHIMVVDDAQVNLDVIIGLLKKTKIQVDAVLSGTECLEMAQMIKYDVIFLDHMMPGMDGVETLFKLKNMPENLNIDTPVIALTANAVAGVKDEYLKLGFTDYMSKPVQIGELENMLKKYISKDKIKKNFRDSVPFLDVKTGLTYCGDESMYKEIIGSYVNSNKLQELVEAYKKENWEDYCALAHAVKSTSLYIGALDMNEMCKNLEDAARKQDIEFIRNNHGKAMDMYESLLMKLSEVCI